MYISLTASNIRIICFIVNNAYSLIQTICFVFSSCISIYVWKRLQHLKTFSTCLGLVTIHHKDIQYINLQESIEYKRIVNLYIVYPDDGLWLIQNMSKFFLKCCNLFQNYYSYCALTTISIYIYIYYVLWCFHNLRMYYECGQKFKL